MADHERVIDAMASVKDDVKKRMDEAVAAILLLAWSYRREGFSFEDFPELDEKINKILQSLSDGNLADAEKRAKALLEELGLQDWEEEAREYAEREIDGENALWRLDLHASHLKEILAGWIAVAAAQGLSMMQTRLLMNTYGGNPYLSKKWRDSGLGKVGWGRGYAIDPTTSMTVVGQDIINRSYQYAKVQQMKEQGITHYRTIRGSTYDCPLCDKMMERIWPVDEVVLPYHPRCVCVPVPIYNETNPNIPAVSENRQSIKKNSSVVIDPLHNFDSTGGRFERSALIAAQKEGVDVVFGAEPGNKFRVKYTDGTWGGKTFEVKGCTNPQNNRNILNGIEHASKKHAEISVLVFEDGGFDDDSVRRAIKRHLGAGGGSVEKVICVEGDTIVAEYKIKTGR